MSTTTTTITTYQFEVVTVEADTEDGTPIRHLGTAESWEAAERGCGELVHGYSTVTNPRTRPGFRHLVYLAPHGIVGYANIAEVTR